MGYRDVVQVVRRESAALGGTDADDFPVASPLNAQQDAIEAAGFIVNDATHRDQNVRITRTTNDLEFTDPSIGGTRTLSQFLIATTHGALRQAIHLADEDGPFEGFTSGAFCETLPAADPWPTSSTWYEDATKAKKIVSQTIAYNSNKTIATATYKIYATDGTTIIVTFVDTFAYSGIYESSRTRTWS